MPMNWVQWDRRPTDEDRAPQVAGVLTALALALLVLTTFARLQDAGPESAVRRLLQAISRRDGTSVMALTTSGPESPETQQLVTNVAALMGSGARYLTNRRTPYPDNTLVVEGAFVFPDGRYAPLVWVVRRSGREWRVDTEATWRSTSGRWFADPRRSG